MDRAAQVIHQDGHVHIFFIAEETCSLSFFADGAMRGNDFAGMRFTHVDEEELDAIAAKTLIKLVDAANGSSGHGAGGRAKNQQNILLFGEVAETDSLAVKGAGLEIRRSLTRSGTGK